MLVFEGFFLRLVGTTQPPNNVHLAIKILVFLTQDHFKKLIELTQKTTQAYFEKWQETREKLEQSQRESTGTLYADIVRLFLQTEKYWWRLLFVRLMWWSNQLLNLLYSISHEKPLSSIIRSSLSKWNKLTLVND